MNRINEFGIEPGPYTDTSSGNTLVVIDVVNHFYNKDKGMQEAIDDPLVVMRSLHTGKIEHTRYSIPLSVFKSKYISS